MFDGSAPNDRSEMRLNVHYRGMDVERGRMSALELGPAIFGVGQMVGRTSRVLYGDEARVNVEVRANFERASFGIEFFAVSPGAELVPSLTLEQLANICIILGFAGGTVAGGMKGLLWIARKLEGKDIDSVEVKGDETTIHAEGESFDIRACPTNPARNFRAVGGIRGMVNLEPPPTCWGRRSVS